MNAPQLSNRRTAKARKSKISENGELPSDYARKEKLMFTRILLGVSLASATATGSAQVLAPIGVKSVPAPTPKLTLPARPVTAALISPPDASRTIEALKRAGVVNPKIEGPISLSPRSAFMDDQTYLSLTNGSFFPRTNTFSFAENGGVELSWNASQDTGYVLDCTFGGDNSEGTNVVAVNWNGAQWADVGSSRVAGGHAAIVMLRGTRPPVRVSVDRFVFLSQCDITPFAN